MHGIDDHHTPKLIYSKQVLAESEQHLVFAVYSAGDRCQRHLVEYEERQLHENSQPMCMKSVLRSTLISILNESRPKSHDLLWVCH